MRYVHSETSIHVCDNIVPKDQKVQTQVFVNGEHEFSMPTNWGTKSGHERMKLIHATIWMAQKHAK